MKSLLILLIFLPCISSAQQPDSVYNYEFDIDSAHWKQTYKTLYTYNNFGELSLLVGISVDGQQFSNTIRKVYNYNNAGHLVDMVAFSWQSGNWVEYQKEVRLYNQDTLSEIDTYNYNLNSLIWVPAQRRTYTYSVLGNLENILIENYDADSSLWYNAQKIEYIVNGQQQLTQQIQYVWYSFQQQWHVTDTYLTSYDNFNRPDTIVFGNPSVLDNRILNTYFQNTDTIVSTITQNNWSGTGFRNGVKYLHILNSDLTTDTLYTIYADPTYNTWEPPMYYDKYFYPGITGLKENTIKAILYPNPSSTAFRISMEASGIIPMQVEVIDVLGRVKLNNMYDVKTGIDVSVLEQGIYYVRISTAKGVSTVRFIKQ
jgi:hypothetical protein